VFSREAASAAAPTAGLHFSEPMLARLRQAGIGVAALTLRIGLDTFQPVREAHLSAHVMHRETYAIPTATRASIDACRATGGRVVAVGTTVVRALEAAAAEGRDEGHTGLFIRPGHRFTSVDVMLTNFHLPKSTLLVLVSAFAGRERVLGAYAAAVREAYRFYSFGDAMLIYPPGAPG
jgi:S-adenosylmethionine:tRNA ribosyltransferase-isomerase